MISLIAGVLGAAAIFVIALLILAALAGQFEGGL